MYYSSQSYTANTLSEAMTQHDLSNHRPAISRGEEITSAVIRHILLLPAYFITAAAAITGLLCLAHALGIIS